MKNFYSKTYKYAPIILLVFALLYNNPNVLSLLIGCLIAVLGESFRLKSIKSKKEKITFWGNGLIYLGLAIMSNAFFPYFQLITGIYYYFYSKTEFLIVSNNFYESEQEIKSAFSIDKSAIKSWGLTAFAFILIWSIRRL